MNSLRLRVGSRTEIEGSLIGLNLDSGDTKTGLMMQTEIMSAGASPRITGCTALDMVQTASNRIQGGWAANENSVTLAAAKLILQESGGLLGSETGSPDINSADELVFANPKLFKQLVQIRQAL